MFLEEKDKSLSNGLILDKQWKIYAANVFESNEDGIRVELIQAKKTALKPEF